MREEIKQFAEVMEAVMASHDAEKGNSWEGFDVQDALDVWDGASYKMHLHIKAYDRIIERGGDRVKKKDILVTMQRKLADVANTSMIAHKILQGEIEYLERSKDE